MNKSLAAHYFKLSADQGFTQPQFHYGLLLALGDGYPMNRSLLAHYYHLSADQVLAQTQFNYALLLYHGDGSPMNKSLAAEYFKCAADQGIETAQSLYQVAEAEKDTCEAFLFNINGKRRDEIEEDYAMDEFAKWVEHPHEE
jgi:TPR repeat protein